MHVALFIYYYYRTEYSIYDTIYYVHDYKHGAPPLGPWDSMGECPFPFIPVSSASTTGRRGERQAAAAASQPRWEHGVYVVY